MSKDNEDICMHDGCNKPATQFEEDANHWHDWIWCDEHGRIKQDVITQALDD